MFLWLISFLNNTWKIQFLRNISPILYQFSKTFVQNPYYQFIYKFGNLILKTIKMYNIQSVPKVPGYSNISRNTHWIRKEKNTCQFFLKQLFSDTNYDVPLPYPGDKGRGVEKFNKNLFFYENQDFSENFTKVNLIKMSFWSQTVLLS